MKVFAPSFARTPAMARPMPAVPPVTTAVFPLICKSIHGWMQTGGKTNHPLSGSSHRLRIPAADLAFVHADTGQHGRTRRPESEHTILKEWLPGSDRIVEITM